MKCFFIYILIIIFIRPIIVHGQWTQVNGSTLHIQCLALSGTNLYAASQTVIHSTDDGITWNYPTAGPRGSSTRALVSIARLIFAGTDGQGIYSSSDSGANWIKVNNGLNLGKDQYIWGLGFCGQTLFALSQFKGAVRSVDGINWIQSDSGLPSNRVFTVISSGNNFLAGTAIGLYISTNQGLSWSAKNDDLKNKTICGFVYSTTNLYAATYSGVFKSIDSGGSWTQINSGLQDTIIQSLVADRGTLFAGTRSGGVFRLSDTSSRWLLISKDLPDSNINALAINDKYLFAGTNSTGIWRFPLSALSKVEQNCSNSNGIIFHPNYPNPFSTQTTISFSTSKNEFVDVEIFNVLGKEHTHIFSGELDAGNHSYQWNSANITPGIYTCIVKTTDGSKAEQSIIVK